MQKKALGLRTWVEIDTKAIARNYRAFRSLLPRSCKLMVVVKSNAYGHGIVPFAKQVEKLGADFLAVDSFEEALELRQHKLKSPILVFGHVLEGHYKSAAAENISITVSNFDTVRALKKIKQRIKIHIKADTGLGRQGFLEKDMQKVLSEIQNNKNILVEGLYTHFAGAETPRLATHSKKQMTVFKKWQKNFAEAGHTPLVHAGASAATVFFPDFHFGMVRVGLGIYGLYASPEMARASKIKLSPVLTWKTIISETKNLPKGTGIGYDLTEKLKKDSTIAICPIGYWHGYPRSLSSKGIIWVHNKPAKVIGRISMDMLAIDVSNIKNARQGDIVTLIGKNPNAEEVAQHAGTINYEIVARINPLINRLYY